MPLILHFHTFEYFTFSWFWGSLLFTFLTITLLISLCSPKEDTRLGPSVFTWFSTLCMLELRWKHSTVLLLLIPWEIMLVVGGYQQQSMSSLSSQMYALLEQLKDSCVLNTSLNAESLVIFSKGKNEFRWREGIHFHQEFLVWSGIPPLLLLRACHSKVCHFYRKDESRKIWKTLLYCISKTKSVSKGSLSGVKKRNLNSEKINKRVFISVCVKTKSHPDVTVGAYYPTGCTTFQQ